jgi:hypothetical protein
MSIYKGGGVTRRAVEASPQTYARIGGILYLFIIVVGFRDAVPRRPSGRTARIRVQWRACNNPVCSAQAGEPELGFAGGVPDDNFERRLWPQRTLPSCGRDRAWGAGPSDRGVDPFPDYLEAFDPQQLHALAYLSLRLHGYGFAIGLIFFGFTIVLLGYLIYRSGYLPRIIGVLLVIGGLGYLTNSFAQILGPALAASLLPWDLLPASLGELGLALWLTVKGINVQKWKERAQE